MNKGINVLGLFDGMSCGQIALDRIGVKVDNYFASEIDSSAIEVTQRNYPNTKQVGDILDLKGKDLPSIDLMFGGSPCQTFSSAGNGTGFDGESGLFFEFVRLLKEVNPKYFMLENVVMKKEWMNAISDILGVQPIKIKSNLLGAQNRVRLYWTNIPNVVQPDDLGIYIEDIVDDESSIPDDVWLKAKNTYLLYRKMDFKGCPKVSAIDVYNKKYRIDRKTPTITLPHHNSLRLMQNGRLRKFTANELERLQNVPIDYTKGGTLNSRHALLGNGWDVSVIEHILKNII